MKRSVHIATVVGARPQFVKAAPVSRAFAAFNSKSAHVEFVERIVHTGQHYDERMSKVFFDDLKIPQPHINLGVGSGNHGQQTGLMLRRIERYLERTRPDWVLVYGDTNSTLAASLAAVKLHIPVAHVEAGMRCFNLRVPEEVNRAVTDRVSQLLLCATETAVSNLAAEGIEQGVYKVGDVMYDSILHNSSLAQQSSRVLDRLALRPKEYYLSTIHRAENADDPSKLVEILEALTSLNTRVVLPLHPRTRKTLGSRLGTLGDTLLIVDPLPYLDMLMLEKNARIVLTDSGGVQKEAYWFCVPCVTLRNETEWVELVDAGYNVTVGASKDRILSAIADFESTERTLSFGQQQLYGDGRSADRIVGLLAGEHQSS